MRRTAPPPDGPTSALASAFVIRTEPGIAAVSATADESVQDGSPEVPHWPASVAAAAYHGVGGDFVRAVLPASESDPAALLISFLVGVGSLVGRHVYYQVERDRHYTNLFALIAGATGHARKGSSWGWVRSVLQLTDPRFVVDNLKTGLSSGEGLIHHVRDGTTTPPTSAGKSGSVTERDPGIADKRLLIYESEFARVIALLEKEGSTLSPTMRQAWDSGMLSTLTKLNAEHATDAHLSILAHITPGELRKKLRTVELTNGFANRFLFVASRKSKQLPDGGRVQDGALERIAGELRRVADGAKTERPLEMTPKARARWHEVYGGELSEVSASELLEAATSRAAPQVLRLSCVYAVLDRADRIDLPHLCAALAVWRYCFDSAAYMLGLVTGNPTADKIVAALEGAPEGLDRTELSALFGNNKAASEITAALAYLQDRGRIERRSVKPEPGRAGRPAERWHCTKETKKTKKSPDTVLGPEINSFLSFNSSTPCPNETDERAHRSATACVDVEKAEEGTQHVTACIAKPSSASDAATSSASSAFSAPHLNGDADAALDRALADEWERAKAKPRVNS